uniref:Uncharacterized protein n=1 Tax=Rhizophora mucronata TaxID=61149 RepID=A0A2P2IHK6_RHIMU
MVIRLVLLCLYLSDYLILSSGSLNIMQFYAYGRLSVIQLSCSHSRLCHTEKFNLVA